MIRMARYPPAQPGGPVRAPARLWCCGHINDTRAELAAGHARSSSAFILQPVDPGLDPAPRPQPGQLADGSPPGPGPVRDAAQDDAGHQAARGRASLPLRPQAVRTLTAGPCRLPEPASVTQSRGSAGGTLDPAKGSRALGAVRPMPGPGHDDTPNERSPTRRHSWPLESRSHWMDRQRPPVQPATQTGPAPRRSSPPARPSSSRSSAWCSGSRSCGRSWTRPSARLRHPIRQGLDQRRLTHQGLPQQRRRRPLRVHLPQPGPGPPGRTGCS